MSGAYTAKPAADPPASDKPPGWGDWPWPGPFPPGFEWQEYEWPGLDGGGKPSDDIPTVENPDPIPRILVYPISGLETRESDNGVVNDSSSRNFFYVVLTTRPTCSKIIIPMESLDMSEGRIDGQSEIEFKGIADDWDRPRKIKLYGMKDSIDDGDIPYVIRVGPSESEFSDYGGLYGSNISATNIETVWELSVRVSHSTSGYAWSSKSFQTGSATEKGEFEIKNRLGTVIGWRQDYSYLHPEENYNEVTTGIEGDPGICDVFSFNTALVKTRVENRIFIVTYRVSATWGVSGPGGGVHKGNSYSSLAIAATLCRDGEAQEVLIDTITAKHTDGPGFVEKSRRFVTRDI